MAVYAVIAPSAAPLIEARIRELYPDDHYVIAPGQFFVQANGKTLQEFTMELGDKGELGQFLALSVANHWGWHKRDMWEWLAMRQVG